MVDEKNQDPFAPPVLSDKVREEIEGLTSTERAAVLLLLLGEKEAAGIIKYMNPREVQAIGAAMVSA